MEGGVPDQIGRFDVLAVLDRGAMGVLLEAVSPEGIHVVIKMLRADKGVQKGLERFVREQRLVGALRHPNIIRCYEVGSHHGQPYIVSEYLAGGKRTTVARAEARCTGCALAGRRPVPRSGLRT